MLDKNLIVLFKNNLKFKELCIDMLSMQYAFSSSQILSYKDVLNFSKSYLTYNKNINWDLPTIQAVKDKLDWKGFYLINSIELDLSFFKTFEEYINFEFICFNRNIDWSNELLDKYTDKWKWKGLMFKAIVAHPRNINKYTEKYDWDKFSSNSHITFTEELIDTYLEKWNWIKICQNPKLKLNKRLLEKYKDKICFTALSKNEAMLPFILAYPNDYDWNWIVFIQNPGVVFSDKLIQFLISKIKQTFSILKNVPTEIQDNFARITILKAVSNNINFDRDIWLTDFLKKDTKWKAIVKKRPQILTTEELDTHLDLNDFDDNLPYTIMQKISKKYILNNKEALLKFRWSLFRYGAIDIVFVEENNESGDWFQLAFNEQFNWTLDFLIEHLDKFESKFGLSQNQKLFQVLFSEASNEEIDELLKLY